MWVKCSYPKGKTASLITRISPPKNQFPYSVTTIDHRFLTLYHGDPRCATVRSYELYRTSEIDHSDLASGFICALVLIVNSLARRGTYDLAPECMTSALYTTMTPLCGMVGPETPLCGSGVLRPPQHIVMIK